VKLRSQSKRRNWKEPYRFEERGGEGLEIIDGEHRSNPGSGGTELVENAGG